MIIPIMHPSTKYSQQKHHLRTVTACNRKSSIIYLPARAQFESTSAVTNIRVNGDYWIISSCPALFFNRIRICTAEDKADVFHSSFLLTEDKKYGGVQPFRTYYGMKYQGGYSDHLPVWADFRLIY